MRATDNKLTGSSFEDLFKKQAQRNGLLALQNHLTARMMGAGHLTLIKSELDYKLINQDGAVGYFDCKTYGRDFFYFSQIEEKQISRSVLYNEWNVPSGFIVWFRKSNSINFYTGREINAKGAKARFEPSEGVKLGTFENFDLKGLLKRLA